MNYSISFQNLPFEPEKRQVIYVENQFDERINTIIKDNYERLKWQFKRANLDFVYLPMFFNDEEIKEKVLYYAPYLTSEVMEKMELRSSYLLGYMSHIENKEKIKPSFLYAPQKENDEWIFQGQTIDLDKDDRASIIKWFDDVISDIEEETTPPRRYDQDIECMGMSKAIVEEPSVKDSPQVEYSSTPSIWEKFMKRAKRFGEDIVIEEGGSEETPKEAEEDTLDEIREEDVEETLEEFEKNIQRLRLLGIPLSTLVEFVAKYETISHLRITDDLRIILPEYGNKEVEMPPLYKAVFLLFLYHEEGIVLQRLEEHHHDLLYFYRKAANKQELTERQLQSIHKIESSYNGDGSIHVVLTRIRVAFRRVIDEHLAKHYYIEGKPGLPYKIALSRDLIEWEEEE